MKLKKAVYAVILGILALLAAQVISENNEKGGNFLLGLSGSLLIISALMFLYPILFAKKVDSEGEDVKLKPVGKEFVE
ncbi:MAG: isoleucyl-tRNA synthetase [Bacteroidia bacterium]